MKSTLLMLLAVVMAALVCLSGTSPAAVPAACPAVGFRAFDVYLNTGGTALAAYQVELKDMAGVVKIVGIEGGASGVFQGAPYYDNAAMQHEHVIIGAYSTGATLPSGRVRVARVHVMTEGEPRWQGVVMTAGTAGTAGGNKIDANVTVEAAEGDGK